jgi:hypothetical protein
VSATNTKNITVLSTTGRYQSSKSIAETYQSTSRNPTLIANVPSMPSVIDYSKWDNLDVSDDEEANDNYEEEEEEYGEDDPPAK